MRAKRTLRWQVWLLAINAMMVGTGDGATVYVPRHSGEQFDRATPLSAIWWFGEVDGTNNYTETQALYTAERLYLRSVVYDRHIYDLAPSANEVLEWDAISYYFDTQWREGKTLIDSNCYRLDIQAYRHGTERQRFWRGGTNGVWEPWISAMATNIVITRWYRGEDADNSRAWGIELDIYWRAFGGGAPTSAWRLGMMSYDRDNLAGTRRGAVQIWPLGMVSSNPGTWGWLRWYGSNFLSWAESGSVIGGGKASYAVPPPAVDYVRGTETTIVIRSGMGGYVVEDACVGASEFLCPGDDNYNFGYGRASWGGNVTNIYFHVQHQADAADWPCFAKIYVRFPLTGIPANKVITRAVLRMCHKFPTSGGTEGERSLIHVFPVASEIRGRSEAWRSDTLCWNNAPYAHWNAAGTWVDRTGFAERGWDNLPVYTWDVSSAIPLMTPGGMISFALYSTDNEYHTGKSFVHSGEFETWGNQAQRPTLIVTYADIPECGLGGLIVIVVGLVRHSCMRYGASHACDER